MADKNIGKAEVPVNPAETIGDRIERRRKELGLTQSQLAERCHIGNKATISQYENGSRTISSDMLVIIADVLQTSPEYLLLGKAPEDSFIYEICRISGRIRTGMGKRCAIEHLTQVHRMEKELHIENDTNAE